MSLLNEYNFFLSPNKVKRYNINLNLKDLLLYLHFIKCYPTIDQIVKYHKTILKKLNNVKKNILILNDLNPINSKDRLSQIPLIIDGIKIFSVVDTTISELVISNCNSSGNNQLSNYFMNII
ncbi:hypothetical protein ACTFIT_002420 [Dictyostelium discoideum]